MTAIRDEVIFWLGFERRRAKTSVAYEHGLDADGELVHIADAERGGRYFCAGCGERLIAVLGDKRPRRFRHCTAEDSANCSTEHAIRRIAKMSVTYEHGLDADGELVHIADAERGGRYFCAGCGKRLIQVLGDERPLSFRHRSAADGDACEPEHAIFRMAKLAIVAGWRAAKANGWEYPIVMPCESCQTDARVLDATDFDHADDGSELVEGTRGYAALGGDILADSARRWIEVSWPDIAFWGGRAPMAIKIRNFSAGRRAMVQYRKAGSEFFRVAIRHKDEAIKEMSRRVKVEADERVVCEPCRKKANLIVRRLRKEERQARERGELLDGDGTATDGQSEFRSGAARALMEMGRSQNNPYFLRLSDKIEKSERARPIARVNAHARVRNAAKKHRQAVGDSQDWICPYCGTDVSGRVGTIDHKIPVSCGGTSEPDNLAIICQPCNSSKSDSTPEEYRDYRSVRAARRISKKDRQAIGDSQDWICPRCGRDVSERKGGLYLNFPVPRDAPEWDSLIILCQHCNPLKKYLTPEEYRAYRKQFARHISNKRRQAIGDSQGWQCPICGRDVSGRKGALNLKFPAPREVELDSLVILCRKCYFSQRDWAL